MKIDFLISSERSGSNLITKLLDNHSKYCGPTPPHLLRVFEPVMSKYGNLNNDENWEFFINDIYDLFYCKMGVWESDFTKIELLSISKRSLESVVKYIYAKERVQHNKENIFIKEVRTYKLIPFLKNFFHKSKFIWLVRDPRDMALSWSKSPVHRGDIVRAANIWKEDQQATIELINNKSINKAILLVKYEDLLLNQKVVLIQICKFLGISFEDNMTSFYKNNLSITNAKKTDNWKNLGKAIMIKNSNKYLTNLTKVQIQFIEYTCENEMSYLGYKNEFELLTAEQFQNLKKILIQQERNEKPEYQLICEAEKSKRTEWYNKLLDIQNR